MVHAPAEPSVGLVPIPTALFGLGDALPRHFEDRGAVTYAVGLFPLLLALVALVGGRWKRALFWLLAWLALLSLALGKWVDLGTLRLPLPFYLLSKLFPPYRKIRFAYRLAIVARLALAALAALGVATIIKRRPRRLGVAVAVSLCLLCLAEAYWPGPHASVPLPMARARLPAVYGELAGDPDAEALLEFPLQLDMSFRPLGELNQRLMYYQALHQRPLGMIDKDNLRRAQAMREQAMQTLGRICVQEPCEAGPNEALSAQRLRGFGFSHLVFHLGWLQPEAQRRCVDYLDALLARVEDGDETTILYSLGPAQPREPPRIWPRAPPPPQPPPSGSAEQDQPPTL